MLKANGMGPHRLESAHASRTMCRTGSTTRSSSREVRISWYPIFCFIVLFPVFM